MKKKIKQFLKEYWIFIVTFVVGVLITWVPIPYYVEGPGGLISLKNRFTIDSKTQDNYYLAYVSSYNGTIFNVVLSWFQKDYKAYPNTKESGNTKEVDFRNHLLLEEANQDAVIYAYLKAGKTVDILSEEIYVTYIYDASKTDLEVGDKILKMDGVIIFSKDNLSELLQEKKVGDKILFEVENNGKYLERYAYLFEDEGRKMIGILPTLKRKYEVDPEITFSFEASESGSSGGFMTSLAIYDMLVEEDLSHGLKIAGTGTIDAEGNVGEIGGIEYKIMGALKDGADLFFVPVENYIDAMKTLDDKNGDLKIISISHFDDALEYLKKYES